MKIKTIAILFGLSTMIATSVATYFALISAVFNDGIVTINFNYFNEMWIEFIVFSIGIPIGIWYIVKKYKQGFTEVTT